MTSLNDPEPLPDNPMGLQAYPPALTPRSVQQWQKMDALRASIDILRLYNTVDADGQPAPRITSAAELREVGTAVVDNARKILEFLRAHPSTGTATDSTENSIR